MEASLVSFGVVGIGLFLLVYVVRNKGKLKRTVLRRLDSEEEN